jgi:hypothetical protein
MSQQHNKETSFDFEWSGAYHPNFRYGRNELYALKSLHIPKPGKFRIRSPDWDDELLRIFMELFEYFSDEHIIWDEFELCLHGAYDTQSWRYTRPFLATANARSIFKRLRLEIHLLFGPDDPPDQESSFLLSGIELNKHLESIDLHLRGSRECLFHVTAGDFRALNRLLQTTQCLRELSFSGMATFDQALFCEGLAENRSVQKAKFDFFGCEISDESIATVIKAVAKHRQLQSLTLIPSFHSSELTSEALKLLLVTSTSLTSLEMSHIKFGRLRLDPELLLQGMERNRSLLFLQTSNVFREDLDLARIFRALKLCPIQHLDVADPVSSHDLEILSSMEQLDRPIVLELPYDEIKENTTVVERMLSSHPEIRLRLCYKQSHEGLTSVGLSRCTFDLLISLLSSETWLSPSLKHIWNFNWYGRYLLDRPSEVPLGLWPLILEKAKQEQSVIYEFLKGPAFVARNSLIV